MIKILCLHGFATNSDFMEYQLRYFKKNFKNFEFTYLNGPVFIDKEKDQIDPVVETITKKKNLFAWFRLTKESELNAVKYVIDFMNENGPFDAIMGFSQGGAIVSTIAVLFEEKKIQLKNQLKFIILCSSPPHMYFRKEMIQKKFPVINTKTVFLVGKDDPMYEIQIVHSTVYNNPLVLTFKEGHKFPRLSLEHVILIEDYLNNENKNKHPKF